MNEPTEQSVQADVVVIGAGPAGCAAAIVLQRRGYRVTVVERAALPQAKVCGDRLWPDAMAALSRLDVAQALRHEALASPTLQLFSPKGRMVSLAVPVLTLSRSRLHALLQEEVRRSGGTLLRGEVTGPCLEGDRLCGVRLHGHAQVQEIRAPLTLLATGAKEALLPAFGLGPVPAPTAVAIRAYYRDLSGDFGQVTQLCLNPLQTPGFGWVAPLPGGIFSVGCGRFLHGERPEQVDLQRLFEGFVNRFPSARAIASQDDVVGLPCGGLLRTGRVGGRPCAAGVLAVGDAVGGGLPLLGSGIGPALETGILAAEVAVEALQAGVFSAGFLARYEQRLQERLSPGYRAYARAQGWLDHPWRLDLLLRHASRKEATRRALEGVLQGAVTADRVFSPAGLLGWAGRGA